MSNPFCTLHIESTLISFSSVSSSVTVQLYSGIVRGNGDYYLARAAVGTYFIFPILAAADYLYSTYDE